MITESICDTGFIWNPSICECGCDKFCDIAQHLDYEKYKCRKELIDKLVGERSRNIDENEMIHNDYRNVCNSCTIHAGLFFIALLVIVGIGSAYFYCRWYVKIS